MLGLGFLPDLYGKKNQMAFCAVEDKSLSEYTITKLFSGA